LLRKARKARAERGSLRKPETSKKGGGLSEDGKREGEVGCQALCSPHGREQRDVHSGAKGKVAANDSQDNMEKGGPPLRAIEKRWAVEKKRKKEKRQYAPHLRGTDL